MNEGEDLLLILNSWNMEGFAGEKAVCFAQVDTSRSFEGSNKSLLGLQ